MSSPTSGGPGDRRLDIDSQLRHIHLLNIKVHDRGWETFSKGLAIAKNLDQLKINLCDLDRGSLDWIAKGLKFNKSIQILDLSYNFIEDRDSDMIARIVSDQTQARDQSKWQKDLRLARDPTSPASTEVVRVPGLKELYLSNNKLGKVFLKSILSALKFDDYIRVVDLKSNGLTEDAVADTQFLKQVQRNESITNIDLRENPCFDRKVKFKLSLVMIRNIERLRS